MFALVTSVLGRIPSWLWIGLGVIALLAFAHLSGRWLEAEACHKAALAETAKQVEAALSEQAARYTAADADRDRREKREKVDLDKEKRIIGEIHATVIPTCAVPADVMRLLDEAGR